MFEFNLQRFDEEPSEQPTNSEPETSTEEEKPIPEELGGLPEDIARETLAEWEKSQPKPEEEPQTQEEPPKPQTEESVPYARFKEKVDEANQLKAQLAEYQRKAQQPQESQQAPQQRQFQPPQMRITPEVSARISEAIKAEAMALTGMSTDDVSSLEYADADDPRIAQWNQATSIAQNRVYNAIQQAQVAQQQQAQQFYNNHLAATQTYNEFAQKEFAEPDFKEIQKFATNEFFEQLKPNEQQIIANSYLRVERQIASPAEMLVVKKYYEQAKAAYRTRGAKKTASKQAQPAPQLPRSDQLKGTSGTSDGQLSARDFEKLLEGDFTKLDEKTRNKLLGFN
ncbi:MAG: hypothetical protein IJK81_13380 [Selenomonadaceae bacterium]|nr:hypothetical protein [Selenomonadaceae bacterium]